MQFAPPPRTACWRHEGLRSGFEVAYFIPERGGLKVNGTTAGLQGHDTWVVTYSLLLDEAWATRSARIASMSLLGAHECLLECDGAGHWLVDGEDAAALDGCLDVDLESSALTNALPVHRLCLDVAEHADAPAAYVRATGGEVERLEQHYARVDDDRGHRQYDYRAPAFDFSCRLVYDESGLVIDYPGIAARAG